MTGAEIATLASVAGNLVLAMIGYWQNAKKRDAEGKLETVAEAMATIERAINDNKSVIDSAGAGNRIAATIRSYGEAAKTSVDAARMLARAVNEQITQARKEAYVACIAAQEVRARAAREAELAAEDASVTTPE